MFDKIDTNSIVTTTITTIFGGSFVAGILQFFQAKRQTALDANRGRSDINKTDTDAAIALVNNTLAISKTLQDQLFSQLEDVKTQYKTLQAQFDIVVESSKQLADTNDKLTEQLRQLTEQNGLILNRNTDLIADNKQLKQRLLTAGITDGIPV